MTSSVTWSYRPPPMPWTNWSARSRRKNIVSVRARGARRTSLRRHHASRRREAPASALTSRAKSVPLGSTRRAAPPTVRTLAQVLRRGGGKLRAPGGVGEAGVVGDRPRSAGPAEVQVLGRVGVDREVVRRPTALVRGGVNQGILHPHARVIELGLVAGRDQQLIV